MLRKPNFAKAFASFAVKKIFCLNYDFSSPLNSPEGGEQALLQDVTNLYQPKRRLFPPFGGIKGGCLFCLNQDFLTTND